MHHTIINHQHIHGPIVIVIVIVVILQGEFKNDAQQFLSVEFICSGNKLPLPLKHTYTYLILILVFVSV
jgi:hypothetical protein